MKTKLLALLLLSILAARLLQAQSITPTQYGAMLVSPSGSGNDWTGLTGGAGGTFLSPTTYVGTLTCTSNCSDSLRATWQAWTGPTSGGGGAIGAAGAVQTASGTTGGFADSGCTATAGVETCTSYNATGGIGPSQLSLTYNATPIVPGSATTAVYGVNSSGQAVISEAAGAASRVCTAGNGACPGSVTSSTLTTNRIPKASAAAALTDSLLTDNATTLTYTGTGGFVVPGVATNCSTGPNLGMAATGVTLAPCSYTNVDTALDRTAAGILSIDTTSQGNGLGALRLQQILPIGTAPTCVMGAAAGTTSGASCTSITGTNLSGRITVTTGTGTTASAVLFTLTWNGSPLGTAPNACPIQATSVNAIGQVAMVYPSYPSTTGLVVNVAGSAVPISTVYTYSYGPCI